MGLSVVEPILTAGPWAFVLVVCAPTAAIMIMFVAALVLVPKDKRVEAIEAMANFVKAIKPGKRGPLP